MTSGRNLLITALSLLCAPAAMMAHHALPQQFDMTQTIMLNGAVKKIDWSNPHVRIYVEVPDEKKPVTWELYMGSPNLQIMSGMKIDTYRPGDHVTIDAYPARDGSRTGYAKKVVAFSGRIPPAPKNPR